jgi:hypothetical protein
MCGPGRENPADMPIRLEIRHAAGRRCACGTSLLKLDPHFFRKKLTSVIVSVTSMIAVPNNICFALLMDQHSFTRPIGGIRFRKWPELLPMSTRYSRSSYSSACAGNCTSQIFVPASTHSAPTCFSVEFSSARNQTTRNNAFS